MRGLYAPSIVCHDVHALCQVVPHQQLHDRLILTTTEEAIRMRYKSDTAALSRRGVPSTRQLGALVSLERNVHDKATRELDGSAAYVFI